MRVETGSFDPDVLGFTPSDGRWSTCRAMTLTDVSIIILNWNGRSFLPGCLEAIPRTAEVIVVDNASTDGSVELLEAEYPWVRTVINAANLGFGAANNVGVRYANREFLLFLNNDTVVENGALDAMRRAFDQDPDIGLVGARLERPDGTVQSSSARELISPVREFRRMVTFDDREAVYGAGIDYERSQYTPSVCGAALMIRRNVFAAIGGWNELYFAYAEDVELCKQAVDRGWKVWYEASARILHFHGGSSKQRGWTAALWGHLIGHRSVNLYLRRHHGRVAGLIHALLYPVDLLFLFGRGIRAKLF